MRVAFDVTVSGRAATGVGVYARQLFAALIARGVDVRLWQHPLGPTGNRWRRTGNGIRLAAWQAIGVSRRCAQEKVSLLHATTSVGPFAIRHPLVLTIHDATTVTMPIHHGVSDHLFHRLFSVSAARRADAIVAPTRAAADAIVEHYGVARERIRVVPLGVAPEFRDVAARDVSAMRMQYALARPYVLYVGANTPRKNLSTLVGAMAIVRRSIPDVDLVIAGPPTPQDATLVEAGRRAGLGSALRLLGLVPDHLLPAVYAGASCLAYVSRCEGFGLPIAEAMAAGVPVITSNCSSMPEVAGNAALLVDPMWAGEIAAAIERVLSDDGLRADLRQKGLARSCDFDWHRTAQLMERVYCDVAGTGPQ